MATDKTVSFPVRLPIELDADLQRAAGLTGISKQDLMRLCMRIGLSDLRAAEYDLPGIVKRIADDKGVSFQQWSQQVSSDQTQPKKNSTGAPPTHANNPTPPMHDNMVQLPPPCVVATLLHDTIDMQPSAAVTNPDSGANYKKEPRKKA